MAVRARGKSKKVNLALQGGGAHGAFTWGVLDRLLEDERLTIDGISGTSAGAMNAVVMASGLLHGGAEGARDLLYRFWYKVSTVASFSPLQPTMIDKMLGSSDLSYSPGFYAMDLFTRMFSPYQYNWMDLNPLHDIVDELVDFQTIRENESLKLFVNATHVQSGKIKVFKTEELTTDCVMASACLPFLFKTVYVNGEPYWDGGYSGNPALYPLFYQCESSDILIVQINPLHVEEVPTRAADILDRVNEISFNTTLMREMRAIHFVKKLLDEHRIPQSRYKDVRVHLVESQELMADSAGAASKFNADWDFLQHLHDIGYQAGNDWLNQHWDALGERSTVDVEGLYL